MSRCCSGEIAVLRVIWFVPPALDRLSNRPAATVIGTLTKSSDEQFDALLAGEQNAAVTSMDNVIAWNRRGTGDMFRIVAQIEATTSLALFALPDFDSVAALAGARLLVDAVENGFVIALRALLHDAGVPFQSCKVEPAGGVRERLDALLARRGDATLLGPPFSEMAAAAGMRRLADIDQTYPAFPGQGVVVRRDLDADALANLVSWLAVLEEARTVALADQRSAAARLEAMGTPPAVAAVLVGAIPRSLAPNRQGVELLIEQRRKLELKGGDASFGDLVDLSILEQAIATDPKEA
jgi:ABC-type nitrate/sulfonate/bicarbonate transport system substrate-binding protein